MQRSKTDDRLLKVSFDNCDCTKEEKDAFNPSHPTGSWLLDLREPYGHFVAEEAIYMANHKAGVKITEYEINRKKVEFVFKAAVTKFRYEKYTNSMVFSITEK